MKQETILFEEVIFEDIHSLQEKIFIVLTDNKSLFF